MIHGMVCFVDQLKALKVIVKKGRVWWADGVRFQYDDQSVWALIAMLVLTV